MPNVIMSSFSGASMKKIASGIAAVFTLIAAPALAADMATKAPIYKAPAAIPSYNWTGWYGGVNAGGFWGHSNADVAQAGDIPGGFAIVGCPAPVGCTFNQSNSPNGFLGGVQAGYNYQVGTIVYGIEADFDWRHSQKSSTPIIFNVFGDNDVATSEQSWFGTLRARLGFIPADRWLAFVSGGFAYGSAEHTFTQQWCFVGLTPCMPSRVVSDSVIKPGWVVGGGVQYAINNNWSFGAEYLYISFGNDTITGPTVGPFVPPVGDPFNYTAFTATFHDYSNVVRLRLDYKFQ